MMTYEPMEPPFSVTCFADLEVNEAEAYFEWFVSEIPKRMQQLREYFHSSGGGEGALDFSPESLKCLWEWFLNSQLDWIPKSKEQFEEEIRRVASGYLRKRMLENPIYKYELSPLSKALKKDIGIYVGEVFVHNHEKVQ